MKQIAVIGEILVEIMADTPGQGFAETQPLTGPYPSGAPAIFADQAARLGQPVALVATVGADDFGRLVRDRLARDGVDVSAVGTDPDRPTGTAFVRYRPDGGRDFVFNIRHAACGRILDQQAAARVLARADHLHVMGSSLSSPALVALNLEAAEAVKARGGTLSFDPNLRREMLAAPGLAEAMGRILRLCDLFLPSDAELTLLTRADAPDAALGELFALGVGTVVHKQGAGGATLFAPGGQQVHQPALPVTEQDPTGAGDCFGAAFAVMWLRGAPPAEALRLAAAAGAHAVTRRGPMEGAAPRATLDTLAGSA